MKKLSTRQLLVLVLAVDIILCGAFVLTKVFNRRESADQQISEPSIKRICELATLECFYHNVSDWSRPSYGIGGYGEKKIWIEYDGMVRVGINAGEIKISNPDKDDVITVTLPEATVLGKDWDENSCKIIESDRTVLFLFTDQISSDDRLDALADAQADMVESVSKDKEVLGEARERAKKIIERNIIALGEAGGKHYKVRFVDAFETSSEAP